MLSPVCPLFSLTRQSFVIAGVSCYIEQDKHTYGQPWQLKTDRFMAQA